MRIAVIGSVNVGKSSLCGQILVQTCSINERYIQKIKKESLILKKNNQFLANLIDIDSNERVRGKTLNPSVVSFVHKEKTHWLIDNPGDKTLVNTIISDTSKADLAILVISARQEELNKSIDHCLEHTTICRVFGISILIVCINKVDCIQWNHNKLNEIVNYIKKSLKKLKFERLVFCPISTSLSQNIISKYDKFIQ